MAVSVCFDAVLLSFNNRKQAPCNTKDTHGTGIPAHVFIARLNQILINATE